MAEPKRAGLLRYLKEAFAFRWNLLILGGAGAAALLSGHFDTLMPLVAAAEVTYLAGLSTLPRFQAAIDAKARAEDRRAAARPARRQPAPAEASARDRILEVLKSLSEDRRARFLRLRARCVEMTRIANAVRGETGDASGASAELRQPALDRLLWVFLKLLLSDQAIARFLQAADEPQILRSILGPQASGSRSARPRCPRPSATADRDPALAARQPRHRGAAQGEHREGQGQRRVRRRRARPAGEQDPGGDRDGGQPHRSGRDVVADRRDRRGHLADRADDPRAPEHHRHGDARTRRPSILGADIAQPAGALGPAWPAGTDADDTRRRIDQVRAIAQSRRGGGHPDHDRRRPERGPARGP